jgi:hypothetical protein
MALVLAGTAAAANAANKVNVDSSGVILRGYDAVVYLKEGRPVKGRPEIKSSHLGATYLFASAANKQEFDKIRPGTPRNTGDSVPTGQPGCFG